MGVILRWKLFERHNKPILAHLMLSRHEKAAVAPPGGWKFGATFSPFMPGPKHFSADATLLCYFILASSTTVRTFGDLFEQHHCWYPQRASFKGCLHHLCNIAKVRHCLSEGDTEVQKFIHFFLDYSNSLLMGFPNKLWNPLQLFYILLERTGYLAIIQPAVLPPVHVFPPTIVRCINWTWLSLHTRQLHYQLLPVC